VLERPSLLPLGRSQAACWLYDDEAAGVADIAEAAP